jgi:hypothetical protein
MIGINQIRIRAIQVSVALVIGCSTPVVDQSDSIPTNITYPYTLDLNAGINNLEVFKLSQIADSIVFIPLETNSDILISEAGSIHIDQEDIILRSSAGQTKSYIFRFDRRGKFLNTIGTLGRGPGEYLASSFSVNTDKKRVVVFRYYTSRDFISYDYDGSYKGKLPIPLQTAMKFVITNNDEIVVQPFGSFISGYKTFDESLTLYAAYDSTGRLLDSIPSPFLEKAHTLTNGTFLASQGGISDFTFFNGRPIMAAQNHDTSYVLMEGSLRPAFILNRGELSPDYYQRYQIPPQNTRFLGGYSKYFETPLFVFRHLEMEGARYLFRYDKITTEVNCVKFDNIAKSNGIYFYENFGFIDDLSGGPHFYPVDTNKEGDIWIFSISAMEFKRKYGMEQQLADGESIPPFPKNDSKWQIR